MYGVVFPDTYGENSQDCTEDPRCSGTVTVGRGEAEGGVRARARAAGEAVGARAMTPSPG